MSEAVSSFCVRAFNLASLRGAFTSEFESWDRAVDQNDTVLARQARASIRNKAFQGLKDGPAAMGGFYLFLDASHTALSGLNYIGIADGPARPIGRRIVDRLRDDSALDVALDELTAEDARRIVKARLICALPRSGQNYVAKHLKVASLCRRSPSVILIGCREEKQAIREAEKVLISSASAAGAPLTNVQHLRLRGAASVEAVKLAQSIISEARCGGLSETAANHWRAKLSSYSRAS